MTSQAAEVEAADARPPLQRLYEDLTAERGLIGTSLLRISLGLCVLSLYLLHYSQRLYIWGPEGVWPFGEFTRNAARSGIFSLYALNGSRAYFELVFHAGILVSIAFVLGWRARLASVLTFLFTWSIYARNSTITDGGDNITRLVLFYMMFMNTAAHFSLDADLGRANRAAERGRGFGLRGLFHNAGLTLVVFQLCVMYVIAAMHKISGPLWQSGTAMYYVMQVREFSWSPLVSGLMRNEYAMVATSYGTVLWQLSFPFLLFNRYTRLATVTAGVLFHVGIAFSMRLISFSWSMVSLYFVLFSDQEYRRLAAFARERLARRRLTVFYDGSCGFCSRSAWLWKRADLFGLLDLVSFREEGVCDANGLKLQELEERIEAHSFRGERFAGIRAIEAILWRTALVPLAVPVRLARRVGLGDASYAWIARRRLGLSASGCGSETCASAAAHRPRRA